MASHAFHFVEWEHVSFIRDYAKGFFNTLVDLSAPSSLDHPKQYRRGADHALAAVRQWAGPMVRNPVDTYCRKWEAVALSDAALERRVERSLALSLESTRRRQISLQHQLETHSPRSHPTRKALRSMLVRVVGENRQLAKEIAARERAPLPCVACPASVLCKDQALACNSYWRFTALYEHAHDKKNNIPRAVRKPTEATTLEKLPPSKYWFDLTFNGHS